MSITQMLFSFEGRMRRRDFWLCVLLLWVVGGVIGSILSALMFPHVVFINGPRGVWPLMAGGFWRVSGLIWLLMLWPEVAIGVKRCHDRDQSGLWFLVAFLPVIGWVWWLVNLGLLDGTQGPNKYGPSPKGYGGAAPAAA